MQIFSLFTIVMNLDMIGPIFDTFTLKINTIIDLYKGGKNNLFIITADYYIFKNETITKYVNYTDIDIELELINCSQDSIVCAKSNSSLGLINNGNNDFIYNICVWDKEGELKGLDPNTVVLFLNFF